MANELRKHQLGVGGLVEDNPLTSGATLLTSAGLAAITGGVGSTEHMAIVINPDGENLPLEVAYITDLTAGAGATGATGLLRGQEGTTAQDWPQDTPWVHTVTLRDIESGSVIGSSSYAPGSDSKVLNSGSSSTMADVDATNLKVSFIAPVTGSVLVRLTAMCDVAAGGILYWGIREATSDLGKSQWVTSLTGSTTRLTATVPISGLAAGAHTFKWSYKESGGVVNMWGGPTYGDLVMEVVAV